MMKILKIKVYEKIYLYLKMDESFKFKLIWCKYGLDDDICESTHESIFFVCNFFAFQSEAKLRINNCHEIEREKHGKYTERFKVQIFCIVKSIRNTKCTITHFMNGILFVDDDCWSSPVIKGSKILTCIN